MMTSEELFEYELKRQKDRIHEAKAPKTVPAKESLMVPWFSKWRRSDNRLIVVISIWAEFTPFEELTILQLYNEECYVEKAEKFRALVKTGEIERVY
jgi:hypothetical protein